MSSTQDFFLSRLDADRPFFKRSGFAGPDDPFLSLTRDAGTLASVTDANGVEHRIHWRIGNPYLEVDGDLCLIDKDEVTLRRLDPVAFAKAVGHAFGCAAVCKELVPGRLYDMGVASFNLGRDKRRILVTPRLGPRDHKLLDSVPKGKEVLLVVGSSRLDRPAGDLGERTFTLGELAMGMRGDEFDIDLKPIMDRLRAREGAPKHKTYKNRNMTLRKIKVALARQLERLRQLEQDKRYAERNTMIGQMSVKTLESLSGVKKTALYDILRLRKDGLDCEDLEIKFLWLACSSLDAFLASFEAGSDIGAFTAKTLKAVARYKREDLDVA